MAITLNQIDNALGAIDQLDQKLNDLRMLLLQAKDLAGKNWQIDIGSRVPLLVSISPAQQAAIISQYDTYKSQLVATFQTLP